MNKQLEKRIWDRFKYTDKALKIQARETERRLEILNHAHEQAQEKNAEYLPRETFESEFGAFRKEFAEYKQSTQKALDLAEGKQIGNTTIARYIVGASAVVSTVVVVVNFVVT